MDHLEHKFDKLVRVIAHDGSTGGLATKVRLKLTQVADEESRYETTMNGWIANDKSFAIDAQMASRLN